MNTTPQYTIRPLCTPDIPDAMAVWESSVLATHDFLSQEDYLFFKDLVHRALHDILTNKAIIQTILLQPKTAPFHGLFADRDTLCGIMSVQNGSINALFIHGDLRRKGYGSMLMRYALDELGAHKVTVNEQNPPAIRFYQKWDFAIYKRTETDQTNKPYPILYMHRD
ncbi:MAG: GNAT family N-acetyltransferase [Pseudomonadota bacterium]